MTTLTGSTEHSISQLEKQAGEIENEIRPYASGRAKHTDAAGQDDTAKYVEHRTDAIEKLQRLFATCSG